MTTEQQTRPARKFGITTIILILVMGGILYGEAYFGYKLHKATQEQQQIKEDYSTSNSITFGLFNVDAWRDKIGSVVNTQVQDFHLTRAQLRQLQAQVTQQLHGLISKTIAEINKPQKSIGGKLKKMAFNAIVDSGQVQAQVPAFAKTIVDKVNSPRSQARLKGIASSKVHQLIAQTYDSTSVANYAVTKYVYKKYNVNNPVAFNNAINDRLSQIHKTSYNYMYYILGGVLLTLLLWLVLSKQVHLQSTLFFMSLMIGAVILTVGITTPIIDLDARLKSFSFMLLGHKVEFLNQVLFFQSKSLLGVVEELIKQPKPDAVVVGSLILIFVIILPFARLLAKGIHVVSPKDFRQNAILRYWAFDSAKWDMADVMVIGILMTYIGLNGILKSQLSNMNIHNSFLTTVTTNDTSLQPGYFIFVGYVVLAVILAVILKRITPDYVKKRRNYNTAHRRRQAPEAKT